MNNDKPTYPIRSVDSVVRLLALIVEREHVRVAEAATELGVARSTAHRLMQMLVYHGLARQDPSSRTYVPGQRMIALGLQMVRKLDVRATARPYMETLAADVEESVHLLAMQAEGDVLCLDSVEGPRALRVGPRTGVVLASWASAGGRALLSTLPLADVKEMFPSTKLRKHEHSAIRLRSELLALLEEAREQGYSVQHDEIEPGVSAVAAPIRVGDQPARFALAVTMPTFRLDGVAARIGAAVVGSASEIAGALGL